MAHKTPIVTAAPVRVDLFKNAFIWISSKKLEKVKVGTFFANIKNARRKKTATQAVFVKTQK